MLRKYNCLISAGPTREWIDPVRFISNPSSGKMGYAIAHEACRRDFHVNLVSGPVSEPKIDGITTTYVETAKEMANAIYSYFDKADIIIMSAAVCDHRPKQIYSEKIKKNAFPDKIEFERTEDILYELGKKKDDFQILIGFAAETENCEKNAIEKLHRKNLDWIILNDVSKKNSGFNSQFNQVTLFSQKEEKIVLEISKKEIIAKQIFDIILM